MKSKSLEALEKQYSKCLRTIFRPPLWATEGMMSYTKYEMTLNEIALLESEKSNMQYIGTSTCDRDLDYVEYYISDDDKLYTYLYKEKLEFIDDEDDDVIHTGNYICELICINENEVMEGSA